jgi:hypothetical protein
MLVRETIAVSYEYDTKHVNTLCFQISGFWNIKAGGADSNHCAFKDSSHGMAKYLRLHTRECFETILSGHLS